MTEVDLRGALADELATTVTELDPVWLTAFRDVPRAEFVPYFFTAATHAPGWRLVEGPGQEWLTGVYSTRALVTQLDGTDNDRHTAGPGLVEGVATSSSSAPVLMARMLQALDAHDGHRVLEVGTGTGYNAALLCHRLGAEHVTSIDVDTSLVERARQRLARLGYVPNLAASDGALGAPRFAPFDRIIATVAFDRVPGAWIEQTVPGAKILMPVDLTGRAGLLVLLTTDGTGVAQGRFLPDQGWFMPVRAYPNPQPLLRKALDDTTGPTRETALPVTVAANAREPFEFFAALRTGGYAWLEFTPSDGGPVQTVLAHRDGSWVKHTAAGEDQAPGTVQQGGPRLLWDEIERLHGQWTELGRPVRGRFGLTVAGGEHVLWLDDPHGPHRWKFCAGAGSGREA